ncbi:uncharacterized protein BDZ83DRAFT_646347 [Colletotrichum acutatum]|uniref:Uncharacterized protein n=1 Tax=Glomerella acutata TaxID=27357 RepID=A0AAD8XQ72_GLOAC|nr:uncharacterized protein BDZ83DRAFT_646347 [Colletotrichum acutatum]KAK1731391.1 hypothetical protein BDZ83DRAFT_646347 [Colletotrichum acutatum]
MGGKGGMVPYFRASFLGHTIGHASGVPTAGEMRLLVLASWVLGHAVVVLPVTSCNSAQSQPDAASTTPFPSIPFSPSAVLLHHLSSFAVMCPPAHASQRIHISGYKCRHKSDVDDITRAIPLDWTTWHSSRGLFPVFT